MDDRKKKKPSDYPQFAFRLTTPEQKEELSKLIEEVHERWNRQMNEDDIKYSKSEIIVKALKEGLSLLKKSKPH